RAAHNGVAALDGRTDQAEPAAPGRFASAARQVGGDGMPQADIGDHRPIPLFDDLASRFARQHIAERRLVEPERSTHADAGGIQQRAALLDVVRDVFEVGARQYAAAPVAVEDNEIELLELHFEQLADRKSDQRKLVDGRAVLLLRRTQDGEVDEVDRRIGLQDVAPGTLARMGLTRDQQYAQAIAHAVDDCDGGIVDGAQFLRPRLDVHFDQRRAGVIEMNRDLLVDADRQVARVLYLAVLRDRHLGGGGGVAF